MEVELSCRPNTCSLLVNGDGCGSALARQRRQRRYQTTNAVSKAALATAPTVAPAIFLLCDVSWFELGLEVGELVSVGVASGES